MLDAVIGGHEMELTSDARPNSGTELLPVIDYPAKLDPPNKFTTKYVPTYRIAPTYTLLMPDGKTMDFTVSRIGPAPSH